LFLSCSANYAVIKQPEFRTKLIFELLSDCDLPTAKANTIIMHNLMLC